MWTWPLVFLKCWWGFPSVSQPLDGTVTLCLRSWIWGLLCMAFLWLIGICLMFSCQVWPVSVISPTQAGGRLCLEPSLSPSWKMEGKGRCFWVRGWMGREIAALMLTSDCSVGRKGGPETHTGPPGHFAIEIYKCSSDVFGVRLLDSQWNLVIKWNLARQKFDPYTPLTSTSITPRQKHMCTWPDKKTIQWYFFKW